MHELEPALDKKGNSVVGNRILELLSSKLQLSIFQCINIINAKRFFRRFIMQNSMIIYPDELSREWIDEMVEAGVKTLGIHSRGGDWAVGAIKKLIEQMKTEEYRELIDYARSRGLGIEYEMHAAGYLMPRELFAEHPEYFRMNSAGERTDDHNFCVSNAEAMSICAKRSVELAMSLYGSNRDFYFWMDDGHDLHCHCPKCRDLSPSDQQLMVMNSILKEIRAQLPDARVAYLAYIDTVLPPTSVSAEDGIFLEYAPFQKYTAKGEDAPMLIQQEKDMLQPLMRFFGNGPKKVLEYWYDNSLFSRWTKPPQPFTLNEEAMIKDVAEYREMGFDMISTFACFLGKEYRDLHGEVDVKPFGACMK